MLRRRRPIQPAISLSFIDMVSGGMAAALLLFLSVAAAGGSGGIGNTKGHHQGAARSQQNGTSRAQLSVVNLQFRKQAIDRGALFTVPAKDHAGHEMSAFVTRTAEGDSLVTIVVAGSERVGIYMPTGTVASDISARICQGSQCGAWRTCAPYPDSQGLLLMYVDPIEVPEP